MPRECRLPEIEVIPESTKHQVKLVKLMKLILKGAGVGTLRDNPHIGAYEKNFKHCRSYPSSLLPSSNKLEVDSYGHPNASLLQKKSKKSWNGYLAA
jgi:hypothetical protein